ncbi:MAG: methionyl-tRNA formyltransferase [Alphaproteobacteria bacterium]|nr:methionyl-tRNA formyltransferase [Alphaproteobacteria bacterium]
MGTPDFAVPALEMLNNSGHKVIAVYTQPPRPKGRGYEVQPSPVQQCAENLGIPVFHPKSLKGEEEQKKFAGLNADLAVVAAYGLILPRAVLNAPPYGCINIHASLLPRWRGASPIQRAILAGDEETGITLMEMNEGLDTGPMIMSRAVKIHPHSTATSLHDELSALGAVMIEEAVKRLARQGRLEAEMQDDSKATYAPLLRKEDGRIDWNKSALEIDRQVRALNPWPGVWAKFERKRVKILEAKPVSEKSDKSPGTILNKDGHAACGAGTVLQLLKIQPDGKKPMDFTSALNGIYVSTGKAFS